ncbi:MAG TPA: hypothetical protein VFF68_03185, partial [Anaerolineaceae bacterium]|nr:hypothetical protein [Anaerolineaceae bacterium]
MRRWLILLLFLASFTTTAARPGQTVEVEFGDVSVSFEFGKRLSIQAAIETKQPVDQVYLFLQPENAATQIQPVELTGQNRVRYEHNLAQNTFRPFARVDYWFRVVLDDGEEVTSPVFSFDYHDNRFDWTTLEDERFIAHWQGADLEFGQAVLNTANAGLERALEVLPASAVFPLQIYVYPDAAQIQSALQLSGVSWVAGHASPDLGIVLISVPPGPEQRLELERQLPHELMHILEYRAAGQAYNRMPFWLGE